MTREPFFHDNGMVVFNSNLSLRWYPVSEFDPEYWLEYSPGCTKIIHILGEMDLPFDGTWEEVLAIAEDAAENCGYFTKWCALNTSIMKLTVDLGYNDIYDIIYSLDANQIINVDYWTRELYLEVHYGRK